MEKQWKIKPKANQEIIDNLADILSIDKTLANLLAQRNLRTFDEAKAFFRPEISDLINPFLMKDMEKAVERLERAITNNEKILVYGDYDVDGTTSVALVYSFLSQIHSNLDFYIPDRYNEGYGISTQGIDYAKHNNCSLVIALDCGIKANEKIAYANQNNIDFLICDHHTPGNQIPEAIAVLDPKRADCNYPYKELSGCGVGFKFLQAYCQKNKIEFSVLQNLLDLVVVSIASDIVPITGENRILAFYGLKQLQSNPRTGLKAIMKVAGIGTDKELTISDCVFKIGPRINAAGRIKSGKHAVELLISDDETIASEFGTLIDDYNITRKNIDSEITQEAISMLESDEKTKNRNSTVLYNPKWHKGVIGIVASRLIEHFYRPTIILTESHGKASGSARSVEGFNLYNAIDACSDLLDCFGGHSFAAGLTLPKENLQKFSDKFDKIVSETITKEQLTPTIDIDTEIQFNEITPKFWRILKQLSPFGPENMTPVFVTKKVRDTGQSRTVGTNGEHLKLEMIDSYGNVFSGIGFSMGNLFSKITSKHWFNICYAIDENEFRGITSLQLMIRDIKFDF